MTSRVTVEAICPNDKEVRVVVLDDGTVDTEDFLQNGDVEVYILHDSRELFAREQTKS